MLKYHEDLEAVRDDGARRARRGGAHAAGSRLSALVRHVVTFGRVLREAGLEVGPGPHRRRAARARPVDLGAPRRRLLDAAADARLAPRRHRRLRPRLRRRGSCARPACRRDAAGEPPAAARRLAATAGRAARPAPTASEPRRAARLERRRDPAPQGLRGDDRRTSSRAARALIAELAPRAAAAPLAPAAPPSPRPTLDLRRLVRASLATGGDPVERALPQPRTRSTASSSCSATCPARWRPTRARCCSSSTRPSRSGAGVEAFAFGTRLTRLTPELAARDPDRALAEASERVVDWSGGTRIGASLKAFNDVWGRRALTRGAVVVIVSDGWEREDTGAGRRARWHGSPAAPTRSSGSTRSRATPTTSRSPAGMRAALPLRRPVPAGAQPRRLEELADVLAGIERRHAA